jgi:hypothetical protein
MIKTDRSLRLRLEEGGETFVLEPVRDGVNYYNRQDILLCNCDRPLILRGSYSPTGRNEGSTLCGLADRYKEGSLLGEGRLPAMVNVLVMRAHVTPDATTLTDADATFGFTGVLSNT